MTFQQPKEPVGDRADVAPVPVLTVGDGPLMVAQVADLLARPLQPRIEIADESGQHGLPRPGARQIEQRARACDRDGDRARRLLVRPAQIGRDRIFR